MFKKAERKLAKLRLGICGPSGSGKTWSSLLIAGGISTKIALLDTERRGHLYAKDFDFDICELDAPYSPQRYIDAIKKAESEGYEVLIIDSLSHAWVGEGGVLSIVDRAGTNSFSSGWKTATPMQNALVDAIITCKMHVIVTLRTKTEYIVEQNDRGKMAPRKVGLAPVQRDGLEYEFTMFCDMDQKHIAHISKDNTKLYDQQYIKPTKEMGAALLNWLLEGKSEEEFVIEHLQEISDILVTAQDINALGKAYRECVNKYPDLQPQIVPIAQKVRSSLVQPLQELH